MLQNDHATIGVEIIGSAIESFWGKGPNSKEEKEDIDICLCMVRTQTDTSLVLAHARTPQSALWNLACDGIVTRPLRVGASGASSAGPEAHAKGVLREGYSFGMLGHKVMGS